MAFNSQEIISTSRNRLVVSPLAANPKVEIFTTIYGGKE